MHAYRPTPRDNAAAAERTIEEIAHMAHHLAAAADELRLTREALTHCPGTGAELARLASAAVYAADKLQRALRLKGLAHNRNMNGGHEDAPCETCGLDADDCDDDDDDDDNDDDDDDSDEDGADLQVTEREIDPAKLHAHGFDTLGSNGNRQE